MKPWAHNMKRNLDIVTRMAAREQSQECAKAIARSFHTSAKNVYQIFARYQYLIKTPKLPNTPYVYMPGRRFKFNNSVGKVKV